MWISAISISRNHKLFSEYIRNLVRRERLTWRITRCCHRFCHGCTSLLWATVQDEFTEYLKNTNRRNIMAISRTFRKRCYFLTRRLNTFRYRLKAFTRPVESILACLVKAPSRLHGEISCWTSFFSSIVRIFTISNLITRNLTNTGGTI